MDERIKLLEEAIEYGPIPIVDKRPKYKGDYFKMVELYEGEQAITKSEDVRPVIAAHGICTCVGISGWSPEQKIGFIAHYDTGTDIKSSIDLLHSHLTGNFNLTSQLQVRLVQGTNADKGGLVKRVKNELGKVNLDIDIVEEDTESETEEFKTKSIALDTRDGEVYSYNPFLDNPSPRELSIEEEDFMLSRLGRITTARLIYPSKERKTFGGIYLP